jgi:molybdopterin synthase catalytic subunit
MRVTLLYFAAARERVGIGREELEVPAGLTLGQLAKLLAERRPPLKALLPHLRIAVNQDFKASDEQIPAGAEIALIPPVAGGSGRFSLLDRPLDPAEAVAAVSGERYGGLVTFAGSVRAETRGRAVLRLEYEAYRPMAEKMFFEIDAEVAEKWPGTRLCILHRVGTLHPGELAVVIAAAAAHRREAFRACEYAIDRLKTDAPIWKKEIYQDGEIWVGLGP